MWLCARCRIVGPSFQYDDLVDFFQMGTLAARREQMDLMFIRDVHRHKIDSPFLLFNLPLAVPARQLRNRALFYVMYARINTVRNGLFCRIPKACNTFLDINRNVDVWHQSASEFKKRVVLHVRDRRE